MKRSLNLTITSILLLASCKPNLPLGIGRESSIGSREPQQLDSNSWGSASTKIPDIYVCGVEYKEHKAKSVVLLRNAEKVLEIPLDGSKKVSAETDSHFLLGKSLYSVCNSNGCTWVCCNGEQLFSFDREEYIKELLPFMDDIWTVSYSIDNAAMCLRKNGKLLLECPEAKAGKMYTDHNKLCFRYSVKVGDEQLLYHVENGVQSSVSSGGKLCLDVRSIENRRWTLSFMDGSYFLECGEEKYSFQKQYGFSRIDAEIVKDKDNKPMAIVYMKSNYGPMPADRFFDRDSTYLLAAGSSNYYYLDSSPIMKATMDRLGEKLYLDWLPEENYAVLENVRMASGRCAFAIEGKMYLCLQSKDNPEKSFIWADGKSVNINLAFAPSGISLASSEGGSGPEVP